MLINIINKTRAITKQSIYLIITLLTLSREWVLNHIFKNIHRNSKDIKYHVNQCFVNLGHSHKFLKNPLFCRFWLPFGYLNQNFLLPL